MKKCICFLCVFVLFLTACTKSNDSITSYVQYSNIPNDYSLDSAKADNCVVFEDFDITSGQAEWDKFLKLTAEGKSCLVRLAHYNTLDNQNIEPTYYEEIKDDYPVLYLQDLNFDGKKYTLFYTEGDKEYSIELKYLKRFMDKPKSSDATYSERIVYVLVNDDIVTYEQIQELRISSQLQLGDTIDYQEVYSDYKYKH